MNTDHGGVNEHMNDWNKRTIDEFHAKGGKGITGFGDRLLLLTVKGRRAAARERRPSRTTAMASAT